MYGIFTYIWLIFMVNVGKRYHTLSVWGLFLEDPYNSPCFKVTRVFFVCLEKNIQELLLRMGADGCRGSVQKIYEVHGWVSLSEVHLRDFSRDLSGTHGPP